MISFTKIKENNMNRKIVTILLLSTLPICSFAVGNRENGKALATGKCETCHGIYGINTNQPPNLAGQKEAYLVRQLQAYRTGTRVNATMQAQAGKLSDQDIEDLAAYFSGNETIPSFSESLILKLPYVRVFGEPAQAELELNLSNSLFSLKSFGKR
jgi:cytochrome c553